MAKAANYQDVAALSDAQLAKELISVVRELGLLGPALRSNQSNEIRKYRNLKRKHAQIKTEMNVRARIVKVEAKPTAKKAEKVDTPAETESTPETN